MSNVNLLETRRQGSKNNPIIVPLYRTLSARELFPILRQKLMDSRPEIGQDRGPFKLDKTGRKRYLGKPTPVYGAPTFRNAIVDGKHV